MSEASQETVKVKIPRHLRLTHEDWIQTFKGLTRAELGVFYAIRTLDPFGDRELDVDCNAWGIDLGLHRTSVSRALESLSQKQFIDMEIVRAKVKQKVNNKRLTLLTKIENESNQEQKEENETCASTHTTERPRTDDCTHAQTGAPTHTAERPRTNQRPEPLSQADSKTPHTSSNFSDLNHTLSDSNERENESFEKFCKRKIDELPQRPNNPKAYIRKYREDYLAEWQEEEARRKEIEAQIEASKAVQAEPKTAEMLNKSWLIARNRKIAREFIEAEARDLGYQVTEEGIFDAKSNSSSEVDFPPPGTGFKPKRE